MFFTVALPRNFCWRSRFDAFPYGGVPYLHICRQVNSKLEAEVVKRELLVEETNRSFLDARRAVDNNVQVQTLHACEQQTTNDVNVL